MIRATLITERGPIIVLGITDQNITRLRAGMPIDVDLAPMLRDGQQPARVVILHGETHMEIVEAIEEATPMPLSFREEARKLDEMLKAEGRAADDWLKGNPQ
jgi:hypothetical protein